MFLEKGLINMRKGKRCTPFGMKVKIKLLEQNMTNRDLARMIGMADSTVCDVIFGRNQRTKTQEVIAKALGLENWEDEPEEVGAEAGY